MKSGWVGTSRVRIAALRFVNYQMISTYISYCLRGVHHGEIKDSRSRADLVSALSLHPLVKHVIEVGDGLTRGTVLSSPADLHTGHPSVVLTQSYDCTRARKRLIRLGNILVLWDSPWMMFPFSISPFNFSATRMLAPRSIACRESGVSTAHTPHSIRH